MAALTELRAKYRLGAGAKYEPKPNCKFCGGAGERRCRDGEERFCICLFVAPELSEFAGETLAKTARKIADELKGGA